MKKKGREGGRKEEGEREREEEKQKGREGGRKEEGERERRRSKKEGREEGRRKGRERGGEAKRKGVVSGRFTHSGIKLHQNVVGVSMNELVCNSHPAIPFKRDRSWLGM